MHPTLIRSLVEQGYVPVIASVAPDVDGRALNINADLVAGPLAGALQAEKLVYLTNVEGMYRDFGDEGSLISTLTLKELNEMLPSLSSGMKPKASSAAHALEAGVNKVHILDGRVEHALLLEIFTDAGIGTQVERMTRDTSGRLDHADLRALAGRVRGGSRSDADRLRREAGSST